jgi:hypothetical protein
VKAGTVEVLRLAVFFDLSDQALLMIKAEI